MNQALDRAQTSARPKPVLMIPLRRCGSHALRLRLNLNPEFYSPYPLHIVDFMPIVPLYGSLEDDRAYFRLVSDVVGLQEAHQAWLPFPLVPPPIVQTSPARRSLSMSPSPRCWIARVF